MAAPRVRVIDLETAGNGPHDVCEIGWQDVTQGPDGRWRVDEGRGSRLVNPGRPITPETMAVHHIIDDDVAGAPFWKAVAGDVLKPEGGVQALAPPGRLRTALLHAAVHRRRALDLHVEVRAAAVERQPELLQPGAALLA